MVINPFGGNCIINEVCQRLERKVALQRNLKKLSYLRELSNVLKIISPLKQPQMTTLTGLRMLIVDSGGEISYLLSLSQVAYVIKMRLKMEESSGLLCHTTVFCSHASVSIHSIKEAGW